jgi:hypothetical protein
MLGYFNVEKKTFEKIPVVAYGSELAKSGTP